MIYSVAFAEILRQLDGTSLHLTTAGGTTVLATNDSNRKEPRNTWVDTRGIREWMVGMRGY